MKKSLFLLFMLILPAALNALSVGSKTAVSRESSITFPAADKDNRMLGFSFFESGFSLQDNSTTCTFDSHFPVRGAANLKGGTLYLLRDLEFQNPLSIVCGGSFYGLGRSLTFPACTMHYVPYSCASLSISFVVEKTYGAEVSTADWAYDDTFVISIHDEISGEDVYIDEFNGSTLTQRAMDFISVSGCSARWHPTGHYVSVGRFTGNNPEFRVYKFDSGTYALSLLFNEELSYGIRAVSWRPDGAYLAQGNENTTQHVKIYTFSSETVTYLTSLTLGSQRNIRNNSMDWDSTGNYLVFGTDYHASAPELVMAYFNETTLTQTLTSNVNESVLSVDCHPAGKYIALGLDGGGERLRVYKHTIGDGVLAEVVSARVGEGISVNAVHWSADGNFLAVGKEGSSGDEVNIYSFSQLDETLTLIEGYNISATGGVRDIRWSHDGQHLMTADRDGNVKIFSVNAVIGHPLTIDSLNVKAKSNVTLRDQLIVQGTSSLDLAGNTLDMNGNECVIQAYGKLTISNARIVGLQHDRIRCANNTATLELNNVTFALDDDFTFSWGALEITNSVVITGTTKFIYQTTQQSTIKRSSCLQIDHGVTFNYAPLSSSNDLIVMTDQTSVWYFNNSSLFSTTTGLHLQKGTLRINGKVAVNSDAFYQSEAIEFGDGLSSSNDVHINVMPDASIEVESGIITYKNVS